MDEFNDFNRKDPFPAPDDGMTDEERRAMTQEVLGRVQYHAARQRMDLNQDLYGRNNIYRERDRNMYGFSQHTMSREDEKKANMQAAPFVGILLAVGICAMLQVDIVGIYIIAIAIGFYLGVFLRHVVFDNAEPSEAFKKTKKALMIAALLAAAGLLEFLKPLFE